CHTFATNVATTRQTNVATTRQTNVATTRQTIVATATRVVPPDALSFEGSPMLFRRPRLLALSLGSAVVLAACGSTSTPVSINGDASTGDTGGGTHDATGITFDVTGALPTMTGVKVTPTTATITITNGDLTTATKQYTAMATYSDGSTNVFDGCTWTTDRIDLGALTGNGLFNATGNAGGAGNVICTYTGGVAKAAVVVSLVDFTNPITLDAPTMASLTAATAKDPAVTRLLYPYDNTVFPRGLQPPQVMWNAVNAGDVYALQLSEPGMTFTSYFTSMSPANASIPLAEWNKLLDSASTTPLSVSLFRLDHGVGGTAFKSTSQTWKIANATLSGIIYYWRINGGRVVRIRPGDTSPDDFLTPPAGSTLPPNSSGGTVNTGCIACHSVSRDGSTLVGSYDGGWSPWANFDTATGTQRYYSNQATGFNAVTPDGSLVVFGQSAGGTLSLADAKLGTSYEPSGLAALGVAVTPAFSPDGTKLAYSVRGDGNWLDFTIASLGVASFDPTSKQFAAPTTIVPSSAGVNLYPTFTPDSDYLAYESGPQARTRGSTGSIHFIKTDGTGDTVMANAGNDYGTDDGAPRNYEPTFSPVLAGGYYWLVFVSSRVYGNAMTVTFDSANFGADCGAGIVNCRHKQLWVTAIDATVAPGTDGSHPAFWLPGQDINDQNMRGFWSLAACKNLGDSCTAGFECCDGACKVDGDAGGKTCVKPPPGTCAETGDTCKVTADCCAGGDLECLGGVCSTRLPS
ncbi:MAG: hypothetical protein ACHREM_27295, partial [Polyangiales bacterium]